MYNEVFKLLLMLKNIKKETLLIDSDDLEIMHSFHRKLKGIISFKLWKKIVIQYSIETMNDIYDSCDQLLDEIYEKYKK